jgi:hypothetical protein
MDAAYISALAALAGSMIGGATSLATAWITQRQQAKVQWLMHEKGRRQELYKQFIEEASKLYADALIHDAIEPPALVSLYVLISRMRVISTQSVIMRADKIALAIVEMYFSPNKTAPELRAMLSSHALDPMRDFSEACREELATLTSVHHTAFNPPYARRERLQAKIRI